MGGVRPGRVQSSGQVSPQQTSSLHRPLHFLRAAVQHPGPLSSLISRQHTLGQLHPHPLPAASSVLPGLTPTPAPSHPRGLRSLEPGLTLVLSLAASPLLVYSLSPVTLCYILMQY